MTAFISIQRLVRRLLIIFYGDFSKIGFSEHSIGIGVVRNIFGLGLKRFFHKATSDNDKLVPV